MLNLMKRNGVYYYVHKSNGKQVWKSLRTKDKGEAVEKLKKLRKDRGKKPVLTVELFSLVWMKDYVKLLRNPYNVKMAQQRLDDHILPVLGAVPVTDLSRRDIRNLRKRLERKKLSPRTVRHILSDVRALMNAAVEEEVIPHAPSFKKLMPEQKEQLCQVLSQEQVEAILDTALPHWAHLIKMGLYTGCRYGELRDLQWSQVRELPNPQLRLGNTKSGKNRTVPLLPEAQEVLESLRTGKGKHVFQYRPDYADAFVKYSVRRVKFKWHFHQLRHTFCTWMLELGYSKEMLRMWLGHSTIQLIETTYGHLTDEAVFSEVNRVQPRLRVGA